VVCCCHFVTACRELVDARAAREQEASTGRSRFVPEAVSKRLQVASNLLKSGQTEKAIEFAAPVLTEVN